MGRGRNNGWGRKRYEEQSNDTAGTWLFAGALVGVGLWVWNRLEAESAARRQSEQRAAEAARQAEQARQEADDARAREQETRRQAHQTEMEAKLHKQRAELQKQRAESAEAEVARLQQPELASQQDSPSQSAAS